MLFIQTNANGTLQKRASSLSSNQARAVLVLCMGRGKTGGGITSIITYSESKLPTLVWPITLTTVNLLFMNPHGGTRLASLRRDLLAYLGTVRERSSNMV